MTAARQSVPGGINEVLDASPRGVRAADMLEETKPAARPQHPLNLRQRPGWRPDASEYERRNDLVEGAVAKRQGLARRRHELNPAQRACGARQRALEHS